MDYAACELLARLTNEQTTAVYVLCPRRVRNMLEGKYGRKLRHGRQVSLKFGAGRAQEAITVRDGILAAQDHAMAEELIRTYLYSKRELLKDTLDYLGVPNEDGLTEKELTPLEEASTETLTALFAHLRGNKHEIGDIALYFAFTKVARLADIGEIKNWLDARD